MRGPPGSHLSRVLFLGPPEVGLDNIGVVGGDTEPRVPLTSHVYGNKGNTLLIWLLLAIWGL